MSLSQKDFLRSPQRRRQLKSLLMEVAAESLIVSLCSQKGLRVSDVELQQAADQFRLRQGLLSAEQTHAWLAREGLAVADFEASLESDILIEKLRHHLTQPHLAMRFAADKDHYTRACLRQIVTASEGVAHELLAQLTDEGRDFAELARAHSRHCPSRLAGGSIGVVGRWTLPPAAAHAVFAAREGTVVGPVPGPDGFALFLVEALMPPELDDATAAVIREELFDTWLREQLHDMRIDFSFLGPV